MFAVVYVPSAAVPNTCYVARVSSGDAATDCRLGVGLSSSKYIAITTQVLDADTAGTSTASSGAAATGWHILTVIADYANDTATGYIDGSSLITDSDVGTAGNTSNTAANTFYVGYTGANQFWGAGWIKEIIVYNQALTSAQRGVVESYLATRHSISI
jgi:hypothetical protein